MCGCAGVCNEQNSRGTSQSLCCALALFSTAPAATPRWTKDIQRGQCPCSWDQEKASKAFGHWAHCELQVVLSCVIFDVCSEYLVATSSFKTVGFVRCGDCFLFTQKNHHSYSWFWSLIHVFMGWCSCPGINVAWKNQVGWFFFQFACIRMVWLIKNNVQNMHLTLT